MCRCCYWFRKDGSNTKPTFTCYCFPQHEEPYRKPLTSPLNTGKVVTFNGFVHPKCSRFAINLCCGLEPKSDIALHINPRLDQNYVVRNSRVGGKWGEEETTAFTRSNISWNEKFKIEILIAVHEFMISINEKHFCNFGFRVPIEKVMAMVVSGKVDVEVTFEDWKSYPREDIVDVPIVTDYMEIDELSKIMKPLPFCGRLPPNFKEYYQIEVFGRVKTLPRVFYINLQKGYNLWPHPIIHLHLNPRFAGLTDSNLMVRNAWIDGQWGPEERCTTFPFYPAKKFHLVISLEQNKIMVWVDRVLVSEFQFRLSPDTIDCIYINGDVVIENVILTQRNTSFLTRPSPREYRK